MGKPFHNVRVVVFCKPPIPGLVKTRLASFLGEKAAARLYAELLRRTVDLLPPDPVTLYSGAPDANGVLLELFPNRMVLEQSGSDLGERMANAALEEVRRFPGCAVVLVGSDIPELQLEHIEAAASLLGQHDLVLGPAQDGGYYAIGFSPGLLADPERVLELLRGVPWSTSTVARDQLERAAALSLSVGMLSELRDLDEPGDLLYFLRTRPSLLPLPRLPDIRVVIPILNEVDNLRFVLQPLLDSRLFREIVCADNGSTDGSIELARSLGARVTSCPERGYGATCLTALADIRERGGCDIVLFTDGDGADDPVDLPEVLGPLVSGRADFVLGQRSPRLAASGALLPHARFGNWLATTLLAWFWGRRFTDLGPFRAITWQALESMQMDDRNFGWTIQMQIRAVRLGLRITEVEVHNRRRNSGKSKVTANVRAIVKAGWIILSTVFRERRWRPGALPER